MTMTRIDSQSFLANLRQSGLIAPEQLELALEEVPLTGRAKPVARALVQKGFLTKFQAELLLIGRSSGFVLGQYRIIDLLGRGGMGRVFKAEHVAMGRVVALKVLAPQHTKTEKARELFMREVRAAGTLMHPNIVTAHDANEVDGRHYLVMEYIDGPNLDQLVRERGTLPVGLACDIIRQAASGLQYAYEKGMVHRDIKPSNILLQRSGISLSSGYVVKIVDFGLAQLVDGSEGNSADGPDQTAKNVVVGTPDYLSPEQARNLSMVDTRSDLYSLGCTFYFLLTGKAPFAGGTSLEKLTRHTKEEPTPVEQLRPDIPQEVASIVRSLMAKQPAHRYQTPAELVLDLMPLAAPVPSAWLISKIPPPPDADTIDSDSNTGAAQAVQGDSGETPAEVQSAMDALLPESEMPQAMPEPLREDRGTVGVSWGLLLFTLFVGGVLGATATLAVLRLLGLVG
jgi:eukaryotic-like serine/threonine-protein kinase